MVESVWTRGLSSLALPVLALVGLVWALRVYPMPAAWTAWDEVMPGVVMGAGALIGWRFRRTSVAMAMAVLGGVWWVMVQKHSVPGADMGVVRALLPAGAMLGLAVLGAGGERGAWTWTGMLRNAALVGLVGGAIALGRPEYVEHAEVVRGFELPSALRGVVPLSDVAALAGGVGAAGLLVALLRGGGMRVGGFMGALGGLGLALASDGSEARAALYLTAGALLLTVSILQESYSMAFLDELTKLPGRRALNEELRKLGRRYTIAMLDVDHFKKFNDTYGHDVGDEVLQMVASRVRKVRGGGRAFRYGGEEFTVLFPGRDTESALEHLEAVREAIEASVMEVQRKSASGKRSKPRKVSVTVSIGAAQRSSAHKTPEDVIKAADKALYKAKRKGRNQVQLDTSR